MTGRPVPIVGMAYLGIVEILYEWNDLDGAWHHVTEGLKHLEMGQFVSYLLFSHSLKAQIHMAQGDLDGARKALQQAVWLTQNDDLAYMTAVLDGLRVRLNLVLGYTDVAARWAEAHRR